MRTAAPAARPPRSGLLRLLALAAVVELLAAGAAVVVLARRGPVVPSGARTVVARIAGLRAAGPAQPFQPSLSVPVWASPLVLTRFYAGELSGWSRRYADPATGQSVEVIVVRAGTGGAAASLVERWAAATRRRAGTVEAVDPGFPELVAAGRAVAGAGVTSDGAGLRRGRDMVLAVAVPSLAAPRAVLVAAAAERAWLGRGSSSLHPPAGTSWLHAAGAVLAVAVLAAAGLLLVAAGRRRQRVTPGR